MTDLGRLLLGLAILTLGVLFLLDSAGVLDADRAIDQWWPALIVAAGIFTLAERPPSLIRGTILTAVGTLLLLFSNDVLHGNTWDDVWPSAIILAGLVIVARWSGRTLPSAAADEDVVRSTAIFGGPKLVSTARHFQGAWLTAIFGGITLDLRDAVPAGRGDRQRDRRVRRHRPARPARLADQRAEHADLRRPGRQDRPHGRAAG